MNDVIRLVGMSFYAYHGVGREERETGRQYEVDCELYTDISSAGRSDNLDDTVDYARVFSLVREIVCGVQCRLLERLATKIAEKTLKEFRACAVTIRVRKLAPPVDGNTEYAEVEITRTEGKSRRPSKRRQQGV